MMARVPLMKRLSLMHNLSLIAATMALVFLPAGMVHASFNVGDTDVHIVAILGPCVGDSGYEVVEVAGEAPWNGLRD